MLIRSLLMGLPHSVGISYLLFDTFPSFYFPMSKSTDLSVFICSFLSSLPLPCCDTHTHSLEKTTHDKRKDLRKVPNGGLIRVSFSCWLRKKKIFRLLWTGESSRRYCSCRIRFGFSLVALGRVGGEFVGFFGFPLFVLGGDNLPTFFSFCKLLSVEPLWSFSLFRSCGFVTYFPWVPCLFLLISLLPMGVDPERGLRNSRIDRWFLWCPFVPWVRCMVWRPFRPFL